MCYYVVLCTIIVTCYSISHLLICLYFIMYIVLQAHYIYRILYPPLLTLLPLMYVISCVCQLFNKECMMIMICITVTIHFFIFIRDYSCFCTEASRQVDKTSCVYNTSSRVTGYITRITNGYSLRMMMMICSYNVTL